ncbi:MAG: AAA family ATPase [Patescibacteria group bacterium]
MKKVTSFVCQECGYDSPSWLGKCPECGMWNTLREISNVIRRSPNQMSNARSGQRRTSIEPKRLDQIKFENKQRLLTGFSEFDGVLGGGIVRGSVILLAGDPGVGKSTLLLQLALNIARGPAAPFPPASARSSLASSNELRAVGSLSTRVTPRNSVLYISGEESEEQIKLRAERLKVYSKDLNVLVLSATNTDLVVDVIQKSKPSLAIIDSVQTMESENVSGLSGSVGQVRYSAFQFIKIAKTQAIPIIIVGHVTKEGMVAGPMVLSHMVDTLLFLEGEKFTRTRILRSLKSRFGPVDEVGIFTMKENGMQEVNAPEQLFLTDNTDKEVSGSIITITMEGTRAFLIEIQALVIPSKLPIPRRVATGIDYKRLELLLAVIQKHCGILLSGMDIFVNITEGIKLSDPGADLGICLAIISSYKNISLSQKVAIGEVGLLGELRKVSFLEKRIKEAKKLGFKDIITIDRFKTLKEAFSSLKT